MDINLFWRELHFQGADNKDQIVGCSCKFIKINNLYKIRVCLLLPNQVTPDNIRRLRDKIKFKKNIKNHDLF